MLLLNVNCYLRHLVLLRPEARKEIGPEIAKEIKDFLWRASQHIFELAVGLDPNKLGCTC